ncbi:DUF2381 family protein [Hyalangium rubrum]|uniref:DUF2381 family protein n=1 Tax=Hyalangium rubrum TaxID=3103134 RepID=A0ABU5HA71_9BACT|nr:DUF2381 family protein [Hyalangium sp. s54d21]MDY7230378.1 DUF2381 family protein [Hyalangium sp. s54d21]
MLPTKWHPFALALLVTSTAAAQPQASARQRQDRRAALPATDAEPIPEVYVAAGNLTTVAFNGPLDRDSLVVDRTRFKWVDVGDRILALEPFTDLGSGERLIMQVGFKDRALPAKAILAVTSKEDVMDGKVEMHRRANTPEALLAALTQKEAELAEFKARYAGSGPAGLMLSEWLTEESGPVILVVESPAADGHGLEVQKAFGFLGKGSALVAIRLRNIPGQKPWAMEQVRVAGPGGAAVKVLSAQMKPVQLVPGEEGLVVVEVQTPPWTAGKPFSVDLVAISGERRLSITLVKK